jgi:predicted metalloprotease with PDZ domain
MYDEYYKIQKRGYTDAEFKSMAEKIAGKSLDEIYSKYINGTEPIHFNSYLGYAGLYLVDEDKGKENPALGVATAVKDGKLIITAVQRGSAAWNDGLNVNDELIGLDDYRVTGATDTKGVSDLVKNISSRKVGDKVKATISRDGIIKIIDITIRQATGGKYRIEIDKSATNEQLAIRTKWLSL